MLDLHTPTQLLRLESSGGAFVVEVDPVGARIASIRPGSSNVDFLLHTPWEAEEWSGSFAAADSSAEWHRRYPGGWHTLVPHAGQSRTLDGVEHPFHGEAAWRTWRAQEASGASCSLEIVLRTVPLRVTRTISVSDVGVEVTQRIENLSARPVSFSWTEHPAFGDALIDSSATLTVAGQSVETRFPDAGESSAGFRTLRADDPQDPTESGTAELCSPETGWKATLRWDATIFPYVYIWQEHRDNHGFPWWGGVNTVGIEPASRPYEQAVGDHEPLGPLRVEGDGVFSTWLALDLEEV
ncbi:MAG: galactose mutarotase [Frondihabitans sp.]|nr:galactose mutarotase [Frondihabitans sp.]